LTCFVLLALAEELQRLPVQDLPGTLSRAQNHRRRKKRKISNSNEGRVDNLRKRQPVPSRPWKDELDEDVGGET